MASFGETLRRERESRNIPLHEISLATRISEGHLEALESDDLGALPGTVFNKGYVRAYAEYLEIDSEPLLLAYSEEESARASRGEVPESPDVLEALRKSMERVGGPGRRPSRRAPGLVVGLVAAVAVVAGGWFLMRGRSGDEAPSAVSDPPAAEAGQVAAPAPDAPKPDPADEATIPTTAPAEPPAAVKPARSPEPAPTAAVETTPPAPEPRVEAAPPPPAASPPARSVEASGPALSIPEHGVGTAIVDRSIAGRGEVFAPGTEVYFWTRVVGGKPGDTVRHVWIHDGDAVGSVTLRIGGAHWRTNSRRLVSDGGAWAVEARDDTGHVLARAEFVCR